MSGLLALLDDVVGLTKVVAATIDDSAAQAAKVGAKTAGVVIDDAAVTPRYVTGLAAQRELPIIWRIAKGSLRNKIVFLLPAALLLTVFLPQAIIPILMLGGLYLAFEGTEKFYHLVGGEKEKDMHAVATQANMDPAKLEDQRVSGAIRTDFILSAEIMAIALANITAPDLMTKAIVLAIVAIAVTVGVYGTVALIVKADDFGVALAKRNGFLSGPIGRALVRGVPPFLKILSVVGTVAMLWVGGGILVHGLHEFGFHAPGEIIHAVAEAVRGAVPLAGDVLAWIAGAAGAALVALVAGGLVLLVIETAGVPFSTGQMPKGKKAQTA